MRYKILGLFLLLITGISLQAKHLVGGDITYECLGNNRYSITMNVYRDCTTGTAFDDNVTLGIYDGQTLALKEPLSMPLKSTTDIPNTVSDPCVDVTKLPTLCYQRAVYKQEVVLMPNANGYYITWGRCCRNETIVNLLNPGDIGMALYAFIPGNLFTCNSSPVFKNNSPTFICLNDLFIFDHSATDADGDSLYYVLTPPFEAATPDVPVLQIGPIPNYAYPVQPDPNLSILGTVNFMPAYSTSNPLGGNPTLSINPQTGLLQVRPQTLGQFVFAVSVYEFRNGVFLSEVKRDIQINVINCPINFPPQIQVASNPEIKQDTIFFNLGEAACFDFTITDVNGLGVAPDNLTLTASGDIFGGSVFNPPYANFSATTGHSPISGQLCWTPPCNQQNGIGKMYLQTSDNNPCPGPNIVRDTFIVVLRQGDATPPNLRCVSVESNNSIRLTWINPADNKLAGFEYYLIERNDGSGWLPLAQVPDSLITSFTDNTATNANTQRYSYRLSTAKVCPTFFQGSSGNEVTSMTAVAATLNEAQTQVKWTPYETVDFPVTYTILALDTPSIAETVVAQNITNIDTFFTHNACYFLGSYRIKVTDPVTGCEAYSGRSNDVSASNLPVQPSDVCVVSVDSQNKGIWVTWHPFNGEDFGAYEVYRKRSDELTFTLIKTINQVGTLTFLDSTADIYHFSHCYYVKMKDVCSLEYQTADDCSILLLTQVVGDSVMMMWNNYTGWINENYTYSVATTNPFTVIANNLSSSVQVYYDDNIFNQKPKYCYRVMALKSSGQECSVSLSNESCQIFEPTLFSPTAFSPNGDGVNDVFTILGAFHKSYQLNIYDRWGRLLFTSNNTSDAWDGRSNGKDVPEGVYTYFVRVVGEDGKVMQRSGTITLIR